MHVVARLGGRIGGVGHEDEGDRLGDGLGEGVVEDQAVHAALAGGHGVGAHGDLVGIALAVPEHRPQANGGQLLAHDAALVSRHGRAAGARGGHVERGRGRPGLEGR